MLNSLVSRCQNTCYYKYTYSYYIVYMITKYDISNYYIIFYFIINCIKYCYKLFSNYYTTVTNLTLIFILTFKLKNTRF